MSNETTLKPPQQKPNGKHLSTASWIAIVVGIVMLAAGVIFDLDARSVQQRYDAMEKMVTSHALSITGLLATATANAVNINNLTISVRDLKEMVERHIIYNGRK